MHLDSSATRKAQARTCTNVHLNITYMTLHGATSITKRQTESTNHFPNSTTVRAMHLIQYSLLNHIIILIASYLPYITEI